jgi:ribosomal protein S18 acetylase RimI-like enzyme
VRAKLERVRNNVDVSDQGKAVVIRRATAADARGILECLAVAFEPYRTSYTRGAYLDTILNEEALAARLASMQIFVAAAGDQIVGTIACAVQDGDEGHLRGMAVLPEWLGRGIAERLLRAAETELVRQGCVRITLDTTEPLQRAMRFYEKHGYRRSGKTTDFFGMLLHEHVKDAER